MDRKYAPNHPIGKSMRANTSKDTKPEVAIRKMLFARGWRFRKHLSPLGKRYGKADIVFTRAKIAVYIDGCFWHGCADHGVQPKTNTNYWVPKIAGNKERDERVDRELEELGWLSLRYWEHEPQVGVVDDIVSHLAMRSGTRVSLEK